MAKDNEPVDLLRNFEAKELEEVELENVSGGVEAGNCVCFGCDDCVCSTGCGTESS